MEGQRLPVTGEMAGKGLGKRRPLQWAEIGERTLREPAVVSQQQGA